MEALMQGRECVRAERLANPLLRARESARPDAKRPLLLVETLAHAKEGTVGRGSDWGRCSLVG